MKQQEFVLQRFDSDEGMVFDWKEPHFYVDEEGNEIQEHLYVNTIFLSITDTIDNYIEVPAPQGVE